MRFQPTPPLPEDAPQVLVTATEFLQVFEYLVEGARLFVNAMQQVINTQRALVEAQINVYRAQEEALQQLLKLYEGYQEVANAVTGFAKSLQDATEAVTSFGSAFYEGFIGWIIETRDAFNIFFSGLSLVQRGLNLLTEGVNIAINFFQNFSNTMQSVRNAIFGMIGVFAQTVETLTNLARGTLENLYSSFGALTDTLGRGVSIFESTAGGALQTILGTINNIAGRIGMLIIEFREVHLSRLMLDLQRFAASLAPIFLEMQRLIIGIQLFTQALSIAGSILRAVAAPINAFINTFASFAGVWYRLVQVLADVQNQLGRMGTALVMSTAAFVQGATNVNIFTAALNAVNEAANRALVSMQALSNAIQQFVTAGTPAYTVFLEQAERLTAQLAERIGQLPDEIMGAITSFIATGQVRALQELGIPVTQGMYEAFRAQFGFFGPAPRFMEEQLRVLFIERLAREGFLPEQRTAGLVQFVQAMRTLGQQFVAMFAQAPAVGGIEILRAIHREIQAITQGPLGQTLRAVFSFISQMIGAGILDVLRALRQFLALPQVQEVLRGVGILLRGIALGVAGAIGWAGAQLQQFSPEQIMETFIRWGATIAAYIDAGFRFIVRVIQGIWQWMQYLWQQLNLPQFLAGIGKALEGLLDMVKIVGDMIEKVGQGISEVINTMKTLYNMFVTFILAAIPAALAGLGYILGAIFLTPIFGPFGPWIGVGLGTAAGAIISGMLYAQGLKPIPETPTPFMQDLQELSDALKQQWEIIKSSLPNFKAFADAAKGVYDTVTWAGQQFHQDVQTLRVKYEQELRQGLTSMQEYRSAFERMLEEGRENFRRFQEAIRDLSSAVEYFRIPLEFLRTLLPVTPYTTYISFLQGFYLQPARSVIEVGAGRTVAAIAEVQVRMLELSQAIADWRARGILPPPEAFQNAARAIQQLFSTVKESMQDLMRVFSTVFERVQQEVTLGIMRWRDLLATTFGGAARMIDSLRMGIMMAGVAFGQLMRIAQMIPGIEQTVEFQEAWNTARQFLIQHISQIGESIEQRWLVPFRSALETANQFVTVAVAMGARFNEAAKTVFELINNPVQGFAGLVRMIGRLGEISGVELAQAADFIQRNILTRAATEWALAFTYLWRGEVRQAWEQFGRAMLATFDAMTEAMNNIRDLIEKSMFAFNLWMESFRDLRGMLSEIGAEFALWPMALSQALPILIAFRQQAEQMMQMAIAQGDPLRFRESFRWLTQIQRTIMEILGIGAMFLPAYTPEQLVRQRFLLGVPAPQVAMQILRGGFVEPLRLLAVPPMAYWLAGLPAPPGMTFLHPQIFAGFWSAIAGLQAFTPQMFMLGVQERFQTVAGLGAMFAGGLAEMNRQIVMDLRAGIFLGINAMDRWGALILGRLDALYSAILRMLEKRGVETPAPRAQIFTPPYLHGAIIPTLVGLHTVVEAELVRAP